MTAQHTLRKLDERMFHPDYLNDDRKDNHPGSTIEAIGLGAVVHAFRSPEDPTQLRHDGKEVVKLAADLMNIRDGHSELVTTPELLRRFVFRRRKHRN